jgi:hypothetical protein
MAGKVASGPSKSQMVQQGQQVVEGGFVLGRADHNAPKTVRAAVPLEPYLVNFIDGAGKEHTQVAFITPNKTVLLIHEAVQGTAIVSDAAEWLTAQLTRAISQQGGTSEEPKQV